MRAISNDKPARRFRRERNLVAKNNKHRGGVHTERKQPRRLVIPNGGMTQAEINEWWEVSI